MLRGLNACMLVSFRQLGNPWPVSPQLNVHCKAVDPILEGGAQIQQILNIECVSDFMDEPVLNIQFRLVSESTLYYELFRYNHTIYANIWLCEQARRDSSEYCCETPCDAEQVFSAHRDDIPRLLSAMETAGSVRLYFHCQFTVVVPVCICQNR